MPIFFTFPSYDGTDRIYGKSWFHAELADAVSYGELKMWFLSYFPEAERFEVNEILAKAKATREAQKAARQAA